VGRNLKRKRPVFGCWTEKGLVMTESDIAEHRSAPDFELADSEGRRIRLSSYQGSRNVVLIFNRGFL
jgi:hypothetical protein